MYRGRLVKQVAIKMVLLPFEVNRAFHDSNLKAK